MSDASMKIDTVAAPVRRQVAAAIRSAIVSGRFKPGARLVEKELCQLTGVSRPSIREALRELEAEGLINTIPNRGPVVALVNRRDAACIYEIRGALEALAARNFAEHASDAQVARLEAAVDSLERACETGNVDVIIERKNRVYQTLFDGSGNEILSQIVRTLNTRINSLRRLSLASRERLPDSVSEIRAIVEAIKARNAAAAARLADQHVRNAAGVALPELKD